MTNSNPSHVSGDSLKVIVQTTFGLMLYLTIIATSLGLIHLA